MTAHSIVAHVDSVLPKKSREIDRRRRRRKRKKKNKASQADVDAMDVSKSLSSTPTGIETPDAIELRKEQRKEPDRALYQVLEEKGESVVAPGTLLRTTHTYVIKTGTQDKTGTKRVDLLRGQKTDRVDFSLQPEELDTMGNVLQYEEAREEEK
ncbi:unnamed protein product [Arabidopsis thaliana]|uniref:(thale cress) hypothetical protein n=1 Tax=Arabidopsis thaliana TaxID=3702 RepID=A0A7G2DUQ6_ARATH|nr:unnamed protein product [Arabidopsis thaliana]